MDNHEKERYKRILSWFRGKRQAPFKIDTELHRRCNLKCWSCSRRSDPNYEKINQYSEAVEMPVKRWMEIIDEAAELGVKEWHIAGGGEPMFLADLTLPVMERIKSYGILGIITTNGTLWKPEHVEKAVLMGWDRVHFSVDGPDAETHDYLRNVPETFKGVKRTIGFFNRFKKKYKTEKPELNVNTVLSVKNYDKLPEMVEFVHRMGMNYLFIDPLIVYSKHGERLKLKERHLKELPKYIDKAIKLAEEYGIQNNFSGLDKNLSPELIKKSSSMHEVVKKDTERMKGISEGFLSHFLTVPCYKPWWHLTIKCNGRATSCDVPITGGDNVRNKSLSEAWYGPYFEMLREKLKSGQIPDFCAQCNPSHTTQRRRMRLDIIKMLEPKLVGKIKSVYG